MSDGTGIGKAPTITARASAVSQSCVGRILVGISCRSPSPPMFATGCPAARRLSLGIVRHGRLSGGRGCQSRVSRLKAILALMTTHIDGIGFSFGNGFTHSRAIVAPKVSVASSGFTGGRCHGYAQLSVILCDVVLIADPRHCCILLAYVGFPRPPKGVSTRNHRVIVRRGI